MTTQLQIDLPHYEGKLKIKKIKNDYNDRWDNNSVIIEHYDFDNRFVSSARVSSLRIARKVETARWFAKEQVDNAVKEQGLLQSQLRGVTYALNKLSDEGQITESAKTILRKEQNKISYIIEITKKQYSFLHNIYRTIQNLEQLIGLNWGNNTSLQKALLLKNQDAFIKLLELVAAVMGHTRKPKGEQDNTYTVDSFQSTNCQGGVLQLYLDRVDTHIRSI